MYSTKDEFFVGYRFYSLLKCNENRGLIDDELPKVFEDLKTIYKSSLLPPVFLLNQIATLLNDIKTSVF